MSLFQAEDEGWRLRATMTRMDMSKSPPPRMSLHGTSTPEKATSKETTPETAESDVEHVHLMPSVQLNLNVRGMASSATISIQQRCSELLRSGREVFRLGLGQSPFPVPEPVVAALRENAHQKDYLPVRGLDALREAVASYYRTTQGLPATADDVLVGPGSKELMFLLQLVYYGDLVVPSPAWVSYIPQANIIGRRVFQVQTRREAGWKLTPSRLSRVCKIDPDRPRIVVITYPSNPTGLTYSRSELEEMATIARRHRVILLSDEIYGELDFTGGHTSIAQFYPEGTIVSGGLSKWCGAGGWRLGSFVFPPSLRWLLDAMAAVASETYTSTSAPIQFAAVRAYEGGEEIELYLTRCRRILEALGAWIAKKLSEAGVDVAVPQGAFYLFPDFSPLAPALHDRGLTTSPKLCRGLLDETGVAVLAGTHFGRPPEELTARLAYVDFDGGAALDAVASLPESEPVPEKFLGEHAGRVVDAVERLCGWLRG